MLDTFLVMLYRYRFRNSAYLTELSDELATHATRRGGRTDISRDGYGPNVTFLRSLAHRRGNRHSLSAGTNGVRCILHVGALNDIAVCKQQRASYSKVRVWALCSSSASPSVEAILLLLTIRPCFGFNACF